MHRYGGVRQFALAAATGAAVACANDQGPELSRRPLFNFVPGGGFEVCKFGPEGSTATFSISATGGQLVVPATFTLQAHAFDGGQCIDGENRVVVWLPDPNVDPNQNFSITITETGATPGVSLERITTFTGQGNQDISAPTNSVTVTASYASGGGSILFKNIGTPACTDQSAMNFGGPLPCVYGKTFSIGPSSMEGHLKIPINSWFNGGYSFKFKSGTHVATDFTVMARVEIAVTCPYGGGPGGTILIPLGTVVYHVPANNTAWLPTGDANSILSWMGAVRSPDLCGGFPMDNARGAVFTATVLQNPVTGSLVDFRFKYRDPAAKGKVDTNCTDPNEPKRNDAATCGASWSQTVTDP